MTPAQRIEVENLAEKSELLREVLDDINSSGYDGCAYAIFAAVFCAVIAWQGQTNTWHYMAAAAVIAGGLAHYISSRVHFKRIAARRRAINQRIRHLEPERYIFDEEARWGRR